MIIVYPMLTSPNISQNSLPGIIKAVEKYILVYNLDDVLNEANGMIRSITTTGWKLILSAGAIWVASQVGKGWKESDNEYNIDNLFLLEAGKGANIYSQKVQNSQKPDQSDQKPDQSDRNPPPTPGQKMGQKFVDATHDTRSKAIHVDIPRKDSISLEPTWVQVNSDIAGTKLLGIKVVPFTIKSDVDIMTMISYDSQLVGFDKAIESTKRGLKRLMYSLLRIVPFIKDKALTGNADLDILWAGTKHGRNLFTCLNSIELEQGELFSKPEQVQKLHSLGWTSFIIADDVNKKATFCMKEFTGLCSTVPYGLLYSSVGKEHYEVYQNIDDVKHSAGPFFRLNSKRSRIFSNEIASERFEKYSVKEGVFGNLNCKRLKSSLSVQTKEIKSLINGIKTQCPGEHCENLKQSLIGMKSSVASLKKTIKKNCSGESASVNEISDHNKG